MKSGVIKIFRTSQGYAIIAPDQPGPDVFLHFSDIIDPIVKQRLCVGLPVIYDPEQDAKGWKAKNCRQDVSFTWLELPPGLPHQVAVRDDRNGVVEVFFDKQSARAWMTERRGLTVV